MFVLDLTVKKRNRDDETQPFTPRTHANLPLEIQSDHVDATPSTLWVATQADSVTSTPPVVEPFASSIPSMPAMPSMPSMPSMPPLLTPLLHSEVSSMQPSSRIPSLPPMPALPPLLPSPLSPEEQVDDRIDVSELWRHAGLMRELGGVKKSATRR